MYKIFWVTIIAEIFLKSGQNEEPSKDGFLFLGVEILFSAKFFVVLNIIF